MEIPRDPKKGLLSGRYVNINAFPGLFSMEAHTGFVGIFLTAFWFLVAWYTDRNLQRADLYFISGGIVAAFVVLSWISTWRASSTLNQILNLTSLDAETQQDTKEKLEKSVRKWIIFLSVSYVFVCCVLIWVTGRASSPFIAIYAMIFSLTIPKIKDSLAMVVTLLYFLIAIALACIPVGPLPSPPIAYADLRKIQESNFEISLYMGFVFASLIVPTISSYFVIRKEEKVRQMESKK